MTDLSDAPQGSGAWLFERAGSCTCSRFRDVMDTLKNGKPGAKREAYLWEVVTELITGMPNDHYASAAMQYGTDNEPLARMAYEGDSGHMVEETGFIKHPIIERCGGSPDGTIGEDGLIEIKCPYNSRYHLQTVIDGMPEEHAAQIQGLMMVTGRKWCDFISFDPRMPAPLNLYVERIPRDEEYITRLAAAVIAFNDEAKALLARLKP